MFWEDAQKWELEWHLNNPFVYREQIKQEVYAEKMGLDREYPDFNLRGLKILDIGGGESSMLLKYRNFKGIVIDPLIDKFPKWILSRYSYSGITYLSAKGEDIDLHEYNEVWIYNVLQHTKNPKKVIANAKKAGKIIRLFEWVETLVSPGHLHILHAKDLDMWLGGKGKVEQLNDRGCVGLAYYGIFLI